MGSKAALGHGNVTSLAPGPLQCKMPEKKGDLAITQPGPFPRTQKDT